VENKEENQGNDVQQAEPMGEIANKQDLGGEFQVDDLDLPQRMNLIAYEREQNIS